MTSGGQKGRAASWTRTMSLSICLEAGADAVGLALAPPMIGSTSAERAAERLMGVLDAVSPITTRTASIRGWSTQGIDRMASTGLPPIGPILLGHGAAHPASRSGGDDEGGDGHAARRLARIQALPVKARLPMSLVKPIHVGPVTIDAPVILAPMTGVTDLPFRKIVKRYGAGLTVSEMIASQAMIRETRQSLQKAAWDPSEEPVSLQLAGCAPVRNGRGGQAQRAARRGDHRHQHGLPGEEGRQWRRRLGVDARPAAGRFDHRGDRQGGEGAGDAEDADGLGPWQRSTRPSWRESPRSWASR